MTEWTITKDHIADQTAKPGTNANAVGIIGPSSAKMTHKEIVAHPDGRKFRMYDDDNELYYEGVVVGDNQLAPLDCFGTPNAGATIIKVMANNGTWVTV